ncbi:TPA: HNH endonuclease [Aeromonas hydrophila]|uniref:HNH endonuclease n=1 Tax=Aeromonas hydrophila TaxID=644 RepID=UPI0009BA8368|nr:HNH endonuclease signature motif containing protein [Aeromonas hydrophila]HAU4883844.1 HNH endonuclease [Aeromonas hydrophila]
MKKIPLPPFSFNETLRMCASGMLQVNSRSRFIERIPDFLTAEQEYSRLGASGLLYSFARIDNLANNTIVLSGITKSRLVNLYKNNLRNPDKPARTIYDRLLASTNEKCPFCGDIGHPRNLDHFLPLAHFPQFSVMPLNLVPSCRDCNMGEKGDTFATIAGDQILHPYLDDDKFFNVQWISARYIAGEPGSIDYFITPPTTWDPIEIERVSNHFSDFDLARRYGTEASKHLIEVMDQKDIFFDRNRDSMPMNDLVDAFIETILAPIINGRTFINHWKRIMYIALSNDQAFLEN